MKNCFTASLLLISLFASFPLMAQKGVGAEKPEGAKMLFDGSEEMLHQNWQYWEGPRFAAEPPIKWQIVEDPVDEGQALSSNDPVSAGGLYGSADIVTKEEFEDFMLHVEFLVKEEGGNSGVYLQNRYEIQILDGDDGLHGMAAIINEHLPSENAYHGVGKWNAYDILFRAARFEDGELTEKARTTIYFNGKKIHDDREIQQVWGGPNSGLDGGNDEGKGITDTPGGIKLQAEGHDVLFRNIWIKEMDLAQGQMDF
jgi:hypothetical protein